MTLEQLLARMYACEINCRIASFWDAGWDVWLGDEMNGWKEKGWAETPAEIEPLLNSMLDKHYPQALWADIICPNCKADHSERGQLAEEITCACGHEFKVAEVITNA